MTVRIAQGAGEPQNAELRPAANYKVLSTLGNAKQDAHSGTSSSISMAPSRLAVIITSPRVFVAKPASQYVK